MNHQKLTLKIEGFRTHNSNNHCYINKDVYRFLYDRDIHIISYSNNKSNDDLKTTGADGIFLQGFCE